MVVLRDPALPVLGVALVAAAARRAPARDALATVDPGLLAALFAVAVALGTLARAWSGPAHLVATTSAPVTALVGAGAAVLVNNLPASARLASGHVAHTRALLIGLNVGPNLAVTGALSALLWARAARTAGATVSARAFSRQGLVLAPLTMRPRSPPARSPVRAADRRRLGTRRPMGPDWLGSPQHVVGGIFVSAVVVVVARRWVGERWLLALLALAVTALAEILIEIAEYPLLYRDDAHVSAYYDTIADMAATMFGGLVGTAGALLAVRPRRT